MVTASALFSFFSILIYFHFSEYFEVSRRQWIFIACEFVVGISMFLAFALFSQKYAVDIGKRIGLALLGVCILGLHYFALPNWALNVDTTYFLRFFTFWVIFSLLVSFIWFYKEEDKSAFWQYNQYLAIQFFVSTAFSLALFIGVASSMYAIENIYDVQIHESYYLDVLAFAVIVLNTLFFISSLPDDLNWFKEPLTFRRPLRLFIQYVLLPVLLIYFVILIIYFGKIVMSGVMPKGWVSFPILIFSTLGTLTYFLAYPFSYEKELSSIRFFVSYFFYFLLPLLTLLFAALITRIMDYGLTEYRYLGLLIGLWLSIVSLYTIVKKNTSLVLFPLSLFLLLFLGSVGPWGMYQLSARSQFLRLNKILEANNVIVNRALSVEKLQSVLTDSLAGEIGSINKYLFYREKINLIYPILAEKEKKQIDSIQSSGNKIYSFNAFLRSTFRLPEKEQLADFRRFLYLANNTENLLLDIRPYNSFSVFQFYELDGDNDTSLFIQENAICFVQADTLQYQVFPYLDSVSAYYFAAPGMEGVPFDDYINIETDIQKLSFEDVGRKSKILFTELAYRRNADSSVQLESAQFYFFR